jgi:hypothetical protein
MSTFEETHRANAMLAGEFTDIAYQRYSILTCVEEDAVVRVDVETNDDDDDGFPDGEITTWSLTFPNVDAALRYTGACRVGISGVIVTVTLDGKEVR